MLEDMTVIYFLIVLFLIVIALYIIVNHYFSKVITRKVKDEDYLYNNQIEQGLIDKNFYEALVKEEAKIRTKDGLQLKGYYIKSKEEKHRTMVFVHGITVSHICSIKYIDIFLKNNWNVLIYDQRRHGKSEGSYSTYGYYEKEDLDLWVNWVINKKGKDEIIGIHGESMGAATVIQYATINKYVKFIIADCGFSDLYELLRRKVKEDFNGLLNPILFLSNIKARIRAKFDFRWASPIKVIKSSELPMMFIHGNKDTFVPWDMSVDMYNAKRRGIKRLYIAEGAAHAEAIKVDKMKYHTEVMAFVNEVLNKDKFMA